MKCTSETIFLLFYLLFCFVSTHIILSNDTDFYKPKIIRTVNQIRRESPMTARYISLTHG